MDKKWVVLCSSAVAAVYASGYLTTASQVAAAQPKYHAPVKVHAKGNHSSEHTRPSYTPSTNNQTSDDQTKNDQSNNTQSKNTQSKNTQSSNTQSKNTQSSKSTATASAAPSKSQSKYKDGTYQGQGSNRRGYIVVSVKINNDKITDVEISDFGMHYSESDIVGLPGEVLQNQSSHVRNVSGATYSTQAFEDAVHDALLKAENA